MLVTDPLAEDADDLVGRVDVATCCVEKEVDVGAERDPVQDIHEGEHVVPSESSRLSHVADQLAPGDDLDSGDQLLTLVPATVGRPVEGRLFGYGKSLGDRFPVYSTVLRVRSVFRSVVGFHRGHLLRCSSLAPSESSPQ